LVRQGLVRFNVSGPAPVHTLTMVDRTRAPDLTEEDALLRRARAGDAAAQDSLVRRNYEGVYEVAYRILGDPELAADVTQDAVVKAVRALPSFRGEASFRTWILRIAANTARSAGRQSTRRREVELVPNAHASDRDPERDAVTRSEADRAARALQDLPEKQRLAVSLRVYQGMSHGEIAQVLGSSEGAVRVNYHLGMKRLRERLA
jgi:RNA polymerase sigma-70 factor, ECF subfamily